MFTICIDLNSNQNTCVIYSLDRFDSVTILLLKTSSIFWDIMPSSPLKVLFIFKLKKSQARHQHELLATCLMLVSCLAYTLMMKMVEACCSKTQDDFQRITRRYVPEDRTLHNHTCENLTTYTVLLLFMTLQDLLEVLILTHSRISSHHFILQ
jgi:hypothetical protein